MAIAQLKKPAEQYTRSVSCRLVQELENLKRQAVSLQRELDEVQTKCAMLSHQSKVTC